MNEDFLAPATGSPQTQHFRSFLVMTLLQSVHRELAMSSLKFKSFHASMDHMYHRGLCLSF
jgi:hypothetical protein